MDADKLVTCLRRVRLEKNLTQEYIASKLGISQESYSRIESGRVKLSTDRMFQLAEIFRIDILSEFFTPGALPIKDPKSSATGNRNKDTKRKERSVSTPFKTNKSKRDQTK